MRFHFLSLVVISACVLCRGEETVARVEAGSLQRAGEPLAVGAAIPVGVELHCAATGPAALRLPACPQSRLLLAADSRLTLQQEGTSLVVAIAAGAVQLELNDRGPYRQVLLRGRAAEAVVTGTLLVGEVLPNDSDLFAVAEGAVIVRLRREVAKALGREDEEVELRRRQHVLASRSDGIAAVQESAGRYQLDGESTDRAALVEQLRRAQQAVATDAADSGWDRDRAATTLGLTALPASDTATVDALAAGGPSSAASRATGAEADAIAAGEGLTAEDAEPRGQRSTGDAAERRSSAGSTDSAAAVETEPDNTAGGTIVATGRAGAEDGSPEPTERVAEPMQEEVLTAADASLAVAHAEATAADELRRAVVEDAVDALLDSDRLIDELVQTNLLHGPLDDFPAPP